MSATRLVANSNGLRMLCVIGAPPCYPEAIEARRNCCNYRHGMESCHPPLARASNRWELGRRFRPTAELPGLSEKDVEVSISGDLLVLKGEKKLEREQQDKNYCMSERSFGAFQRSFALPDGSSRDKIAANLSKGVLTITLPKTAEAAKPPQQIKVKAAA